MADLTKKILGSVLEELSSAANSLKDTTEKYISLEKIIPKVTEVLDENIRMLNKELGTGSKVSAELRLEMSKLSSQFGISTKAQIELLGTTKQYHQSLNETSASTLKFIKASGASTKEVGILSAKLQILSNASESTFSDMYTRILAVRDAYGLTTEQIDDISSTLVKLTTIVGLNSDQMVSAAENVALFTSKLTSAGIEAESVTDILNNIIDPDKLTDNIMLLSKMGYTMSDLVIGDPTEKLEESLPRLKQLGQEITSQQNRIVANEMAKVYGITLETARQFAEIDTSEATLNREKTLAEYRNDITTAKESIQDVLTMAGGLIMRPISNLMKMFEPLINGFSKFTQSLNNFGEQFGLIGRGLISAVSLWLTNEVVTGIINLIKKISGLLFDDNLDFAKKWGTQAATVLKDTLSPYLSPYLEEVQKRDAKYQSDKSQAEQKFSNNIKGMAEPAASLLNKDSKKQVERERKEKDYVSNPANDNINRLRELLEQESNIEFEYQQRLEELRSKQLSDTATKTEIAELEQLELLKQRRIEITKDNTKLLSESLEKLYNQELDYSNYYQSLFGQLNDLGSEGFVKNKEAALSSIKKVIKNTKASNYVGELSFDELQEALNPENGNDVTNINKRFAGIFAKQRENIEAQREAVKNDVDSGFYDEDALNSYNELSARSEKLKNIIDDLIAASNPVENELIDADDIIEKVNNANQGYVDQINKAKADLNKSTHTEAIHSISGNILGSVKGLISKIGPIAAGTTAVLGATTAILNQTESGREFVENVNETITNLKNKVTNWLNTKLSGPISVVNKWLGNINDSVSAIEDNTTDYDLQTLTLAYATADSIRNGQMYATQKEMNEVLYEIKNGINTTNSNLNDIGATQVAAAYNT